MGKFLLRVIINAIAIAITASVLPGIHVVNRDLGTLLIIGLIFGIVTVIAAKVFEYCRTIAIRMIIAIETITGVIRDQSMLIVLSLIPNLFYQLGKDQSGATNLLDWRK